MNHRDEYTNEKYYYKIASGLTAIPDTIPQEAKKIDISSNEITIIPENAFANYLDCSCLYMNNNSISRIESGAFFGLGKLKSLLLWNNVLTELD